MDSLTFDGWVAIVILIIMMLISWLVMWQKGVLIGRVSKSNNFFLDLFQHVKGDFAKLHEVTHHNNQPDIKLDEKQMGLLTHSPLMRIFQKGINELHDRLPVSYTHLTLPTKRIV